MAVAHRRVPHRGHTHPMTARCEPLSATMSGLRCSELGRQERVARTCSLLGIGTDERCGMREPCSLGRVGESAPFGPASPALSSFAATLAVRAPPGAPRSVCAGDLILQKPGRLRADLNRSLPGTNVGSYSDDAYLAPLSTM